MAGVERHGGRNFLPMTLRRLVCLEWRVQRMEINKFGELGETALWRAV